MTTQRWLITGGCGFIGTNLIIMLRQRIPNLTLCILDNLSIGRRETIMKIDPSIEVREADILDYKSCQNACSDCNVVIHLAASTGIAPSLNNPRVDFEINVRGTLNMLEAAREARVSSFILASSGAALGEVNPPYNEELAAKPTSPYGAGKLSCEGYTRAYTKSFGIPSTILRFSNVYGPFSLHKNSVVAKCMKNVLEKKSIIIYGDGSQTRDFIFVDDLCEAILCAIQKKGCGEIFHIGTNRETSIKDLVILIKQVIEREGKYRVEIAHMQRSEWEVVRNYADSTKAKKDLGFSIRTNLREGLQKTFDYFKESYTSQ